MTNCWNFQTMLIAAVLSIGSIGTVATSGPSQGAGQSTPAFETITSAQLAERLNHKDFVFVNVHIPYEGEIEQTDAFVPFDDIGENLDLLPDDKSAEIVLYCRSGRMSEIVPTSCQRWATPTSPTSAAAWSTGQTPDTR